MSALVSAASGPPREGRSLTRLRLALPLALLALVAAAPAASAAAETRIVPGEFVFEYGQNPNDPGNCSAIVFIRWADRKGSVATRVFWTTSKGVERSLAVRPPYNDTYHWVKDYQVGAGSHWAQVGKGWADGPGTRDCSQTSARQRAFYRLDSARVELTFDDTPRIVGAVRKADGAPKAGVKVTAAGPRTVSATTDATGGYSMKVKKGRYTVSAKGHCVVGPPECEKTKVVKVGSGARQVDFRAPRDLVRYRIELKAWIPVPQLVDPLLPFEDVPYHLVPNVVRKSRGCPLAKAGLPDTARELSLFTSLFRGDGHLDYDGPFRARPVASFAWDGERITEFKVSPESENYGRTYQDSVYRHGPGRYSCVHSDLQTERSQGRRTSDTGFTLEMDSENPLTPLPRGGSPSIDSVLNGRLSGDGQLELDYRTDLFPDHGIRVIRDGVVQDTRIVNDLSCLRREDVTGLEGAALLAFGLSVQLNAGAYTVPKDSKGYTESRPGYVCAGNFVTTRIAGTGPGLGATRAAAAGTRVDVAPVVEGRVEPFLPLAEAERRGLVTTAGFGERIAIVTRAEQPVRLRVAGRDVLVESKVRNGGVDAGAALYGPVSGELEVDPLGGSEATHDGQPIGPRDLDRTPPVTTGSASVKRGRAVVRLRATDDSGVATTVAYAGKRVLAVKKGKVRLSKRDLRKLRFLSIDVFGNRESPQRLSSGMR